MELTQETITLLLVGVALAGLIVSGQREMRRDITDLRERMARLEGLFEGHLGISHQHEENT